MLERKFKLNQGNKMKKLDACVYCGLPESDHHDFKATEVPDGCSCDLNTWQGTPGPVCDNFKGLDNEDPDSEMNEDVYCLICEHDRACHKKNDN